MRGSEFPSLVLDQTVVHPEPGEVVAVGLALGDLVLGVWGLQVVPPPWISKP